MDFKNELIGLKFLSSILILNKRELEQEAKKTKVQLDKIEQKKHLDYKKLEAIITI